MSYGQGGSPWGQGPGGYGGSSGFGGPGGPGGSGSPDWAALAEEQERRRLRRKRWLTAGLGTLATVTVAGIVAIAVINESGDPEASDKPSGTLPPPQDLPSSPGPQPSFEKDLPPAPPKDYLKDPERDDAPLSEDTLFPNKKITVNGRSYQRAATDGTKDCSSAAQGGLGSVLEKHGCDQLFRATYERDGLAFTVGIAVFDSPKKASGVKSDYKPNVAALPGGNVPADFCTDVLCRTTVNALGRYAFFTIAGHTDGSPAGNEDEAAKQTALDGSSFGYHRLMERGRAQAEADAKRS